MGDKGGKEDSKEDTKKKSCHRYFHTLQPEGRWFEKTKTRGGVSDHTGEEGKEAEGRVIGPPLTTTVLLL